MGIWDWFLGTPSTNPTTVNEFMEEKGLTVADLNDGLSDCKITKDLCYVCSETKSTGKLCLSHGFDFYLRDRFGKILVDQGDDCAYYGSHINSEIANKLPCFYCGKSGDNCVWRWVYTEDASTGIINKTAIEGFTVQIAYCRKCMIASIFEMTKSARKT